MTALYLTNKPGHTGRERGAGRIIFAPTCLTAPSRTMKQQQPVSTQSSTSQPGHCCHQGGIHPYTESYSFTYCRYPTYKHTHTQRQLYVWFGHFFHPSVSRVWVTNRCEMFTLSDLTSFLFLNIYPHVATFISFICHS